MVKKKDIAITSHDSPLATVSTSNNINPKTTPTTAFLTMTTDSTTGIKAINAKKGAKANPTPKMVAAPLPPRKPRNIGQL